MNDNLHTMHHQVNESLARRLFNALPAMRCIPSDISQAIQGDAGRPLVPTDAAGVADEGVGFAGRQGAGLTE